jgi:hypothetical protein
MILEQQIAEYLEAQGLGTFDENGITGDIFLMAMPTTPDSCITIYPRGGLQSDDKLGYDSPSVQIIVRGTENPSAAAILAETIYDTLHGFHHERFVAVGGYYIVNCIGEQSAPTHIGVDENRRHEFSLNFQLDIKKEE